ncbi:MAG: hypothetical protein ACOH19_11125 [Rhodoglobus sp.]
MRGLTLALTVFGVVLFTVTMLAIQGAFSIANLPMSEASVRWLVILIMVPTAIAGVISGLTAGLGAYIGTRISRTTTDGPADRQAMSFGAGIGGALGSTPFLIYLSWLYQSGPGALIGVLGFMVIFGAYAGFALLWSARRSRSSPAV